MPIPFNARFDDPPLPPPSKISPHFDDTSLALHALLGGLDGLELRKGTGDLADAGEDEPRGDDDPEEVAEEVVGPEVDALRAAVDDLVDDLVEGAGGVVQDVAVELAQADDDLERVAHGQVLDNAVGAEEGEGAPEEGRHRLHAHDKGILSQVARVGEGVLLPELAKDVSSASHVGKVEREVAYQS